MKWFQTKVYLINLTCNTLSSSVTTELLVIIEWHMSRMASLDNEQSLNFKQTNR